MTPVEMLEAQELATVDQRISSTVKALAAGRGIKASELAAALHTSRASIFNKLRAGTPWKASEVLAMSQILGVSVADLYDGLGIFGNEKAPTELMGAGARARRDSNPQPSDP